MAKVPEKANNFKLASFALRVSIIAWNTTLYIASILHLSMLEIFSFLPQASRRSGPVLGLGHSLSMFHLMLQFGFVHDLAARHPKKKYDLDYVRWLHELHPIDHVAKRQ